LINGRHARLGTIELVVAERGKVGRNEGLGLERYREQSETQTDVLSDKKKI